jgi:hypothetical protein
MRNSIRRSAGKAGVALDLSPLHVDGAAHSVDDAVELDQETIAHRFHQPAVMLGDLRLEHLAGRPGTARVPSSSAWLRRP